MPLLGDALGGFGAALSSEWGESGWASAGATGGRLGVDVDGGSVDPTLEPLVGAGATGRGRGAVMGGRLVGGAFDRQRLLQLLACATRSVAAAWLRGTAKMQ